MSNRTFSELSVYEKILALWLGAFFISGLVCVSIAYRPSWAWLCIWGFIALYLGGIIWQEKMDELKHRMQKLEERMNLLEKRD